MSMIFLVYFSDIPTMMYKKISELVRDYKLLGAYVSFDVHQ